MQSIASMAHALADHLSGRVAPFGKGQGAGRVIRVLVAGSVQSNSYCADAHHHDYQ